MHCTLPACQHSRSWGRLHRKRSGSCSATRWAFFIQISIRLTCARRRPSSSRPSPRSKRSCLLRSHGAGKRLSGRGRSEHALVRLPGPRALNPLSRARRSADRGVMGATRLLRNRLRSTAAAAPRRGRAHALEGARSRRRMRVAEGARLLRRHQVPQVAHLRDGAVRPRERALAGARLPRRERPKPKLTHPRDSLPRRRVHLAPAPNQRRREEGSR